MDATCLEYRLTEDERRQFDEQGYLVVEDAIPPLLVEDLTAVVDRVDSQFGVLQGKDAPSGFRMVIDFIGKDELFLELLDWSRTFAKVWGILGWHIQLYHSVLIVTPPRPSGERASKQRLIWPQDSGRLNNDLETKPRPRISLKVAYFLTDTTAPNRGNLQVIPGSHLRSRLPIADPDHPAPIPDAAFTDDGVSDPQGAMPIRVPAGTAVLFDRRLWHAPGINRSDITRKVLFYGYSYRWLRPRDDMTVDHMMDRCDPIRQQLLGKSSSGHAYTSPKGEDVPLRMWIREHLGDDAVVP